jgi:phosphoserine phosphatase RsbX
MTSDVARLEWGAAGAAFDGHVSGDRHLVAPFPGGALVALVDGLGHGPEAAEAATAAIELMAGRPSEPVLELIARCHERLRSTRGAVMTLVSYDVAAGLLSWVAVGNVEALLVRGDPAAGPRDAAIPRGGVVGANLPPLNARTVPAGPGDTLVMASDGIASDFTGSLVTPDAAPQVLADLILARHRKPNDDALVLVVRFLAGAPGG